MAAVADASCIVAIVVTVDVSDVVVIVQRYTTAAVTVVAMTSTPTITMKQHGW